MFTFNRNEQIVILMLSAALLVGIVVSYIDRSNSDSVPDFDVKKSAVPLPDALDELRPTQGDTPLQIDLNSATSKDFQKLPGIGPQIAQRIVDYRNAKGNFANLEDLTKVTGVGPKTLERLRPRLTLTKP
jgi:comEA protein